MDKKSIAENTSTATPLDVRGRCADCGGSDKALQAPRPNVGTGYEGPMYCRECNPRFMRALEANLQTAVEVVAAAANLRAARRRQAAV